MKTFVAVTVVWWIALGGLALWGVAGGYPEREVLVATILIKGLGAPISSLVDPGSISAFFERIGLRSPLAYLLILIGVLWTVYIALPAAMVLAYRMYRPHHVADMSQGPRRTDC